MTASNELICFPLWPLPETAMGLPCNCLMGALPQTLRDPIIPLVRSKGSPPRTLTTVAIGAWFAPLWSAQKKQVKKEKYSKGKNNDNKTEENENGQK